MTRVCYVVHDLADPAVSRRVRMLHDGGATVELAGFSRGRPPVTVAGERPLVLGRTQSGRLARRVGVVALAAVRLRRMRPMVHAADVIVARQLETLVLAALARWLFAPSTPLVFECLDIHRSMLGRGVVSAGLRYAEAWLLRRCALLIISSPGFLAGHFQRYPVRPPIRLVENKVLVSEAGPPVLRPPRQQGPWRIGWFGVIRCARSLSMLVELVRRHAGRVEVSLRGQPARGAVPDFDRIVQATPGLQFHGPYDRSIDLARIYGEVDFTWAIDFFEAGGNSEWLLPNRLYEGALHGSIPLAMRGSQTGLWLAERGAGVLLDEPLERSLDAFFASSRAAAWRRGDSGPRGECWWPDLWIASSQGLLAMTAVSRQDVVHDDAACRALVADLGALGVQAERRSNVSTSMAL